ncbi:capsular polysaccharide biosynthesis protein [Paenibacillus shirakamiensis]|uniref:Capsular polysaccharide biosynthesis protein n=1 Tax=Paenibacillus shirakamiensis TaxID=1265935 RepID=A0ABS4JE39_9BACL|nr:glycosyltransferase family 61 protein [Paenibacillus shirakamiensis]MBP1999973.1 capsular polysaccharide biosynthesis protein [Paenibacillus shirakamiensis]
MNEQMRNPDSNAWSYYNTIWDWQKSFKQTLPSSIEDEYITPFDFGALAVYEAPRGMEANIHPHLTPYQLQPTGGYVAVIPSGRVWGKSGCILSADGKLIADLSPEYDGQQNRMLSADEHPALHRRPDQELQYIHGTLAALTFCGSHNYFHWLYDVITRFSMLQILGHPYDYLIMNPNPYGAFVDETLEMLGIQPSSIIRNGENSNIQADRLVVPSIMMTSHYPPWTTATLRSLFLPHRVNTWAAPERIYISRRKASVRRIVNEIEVIRCLEIHGFVSICLEDFTIAQQIHLFASAKAIVGPHGAGLANLAFCTAGTSVIEIFHIHFIVPTYWMISNHNQLHYYMLYGQQSTTPSDLYPGLEDYVVDIHRLEQTLHLAGLNYR